MRKLATVRKIKELMPIEGADRIELAVVDGWKVIVAKDVGHKVGDTVIYCEVDSFLPVETEFEFLRKSSFRTLEDGTEGFRLRTMKMRGQISQGLIIPYKDAIQIWRRLDSFKHTYKPGTSPVGIQEIPLWEVGTDVSSHLNITKWDPPLPAQLAGKVKGYFPSFLKKTDEERIQNLTEEYEKWKKMGKIFYVTEKLDGSSMTTYLHEDIFGVCSRNLELKEEESNTFWKVARIKKIEETLREVGINITLQGELIGEGIQKNPYKIKGQTIKVFNVIDLENSKRLGPFALQNFLQDTGLETVPILETSFQLPDTIEELLEYANGPSVLNANIKREGVVIRSQDGTISFKVISNDFLANQKD